MRAHESPPLPGCGERWALFLDFDGTLAELAETPDAVRVPPDLPQLLIETGDRLDGALALVSGRRLASLDALLAPARLPAAGLHGLELRDADGRVQRSVQGAIEQAPLDGVRDELEAFARTHPGLLLEDKGDALALHYRAAPELEDACRSHAGELVAALPDHQLLAGKMVFEIKPSAANKGDAIRMLAAGSPFLGRVPVFAGDDRTDEDGFEWVNANRGVSIKVGDGRSAARHRVAGVAELIDWLRALRARLGTSAAPDGTR